MSTKISQLTSATDITASDLMQIVDVEDGVMAPSGTNKKATAQLVANNLAKIVNDGAVITANTSTDAVRITQTGSGNAIVVEDFPSPDATPFVVNNLGHVLIGNSTSVAGPFAFSRGLQVTNQGAQFNAFTSNEFGEGIAFVKTRGTPSSPHTIVQLNDTLGSVSFSGSDGSGYVLGSQILSFVDQVPGANDMPTCLTFSTTPDGSATCTERMRITSAGNVGIGTATPSAKLNVVDNSSSDALRITQTGSGNALVVEDSTNPDATPFVVTGNGYVGIGTSSPQAPLDIENCGIRINASRAISSNSNAGSLLLFGGESGNGANIELYGGSHATSPSYTYIDANVISIRSADGASGKMLINSAGDVGIGTSTPTEKLDVAGTTAINNAGYAFLRLGRSDNNGWSISKESSDNSLNIWQGGIQGSPTANRLFINTLGNVGIGTVTPSSKLHVAGDLTLSSATVATSATAGTNGDVPAQVEGYLVVSINGTARKIPYYA